MEGVLSADHLTTIAEVAIALAGFSALIVLLSGRSGRADPRADALRLRIMLETSLLVVAFALFPFIPSTLGLAPDLVWRISAGAFVLADAAYWALTRKRGKALHTLLAPSDRRLSLVILLLAYATDFLMIAVVLGLVGSAASGLYFTALYIELIISGALFVSFAGSAFGGAE